MSNPLWSHTGIKRLELRRGGGESRALEYVMIGVLSAIIVGSIGFFVYTLVVGERPARGQRLTEMHFECTKCQHQFTKRPDELSQGGPEGMGFEEMGMAQLDCPKCGEKKSCLPMVKCPKCGEYYLGESTKQQAALLKAPVPSKRPEPLRDICPHCKQDRMEWYREKFRKKKQK